MFALRVVWGVCLAVAAMVIGVGLELRSSGASVLISGTVVVVGVLLVPVASAVIERLVPTRE